MHRPGKRVRCLGCFKLVGPGCTPQQCLLAEFQEASKTRNGLCADWPHCAEDSGLTLMQILVTVCKSVDVDLSALD